VRPQGTCRGSARINGRALKIKQGEGTTSVVPMSLSNMITALAAERGLL
jgi:hypothetical protein